MNFLALLGWAPDGETTIMSRDELVERFSLERVGSSPATFDYAKLDWMNGVYLRALPPDEYADRLVAYLREQGSEWPEERMRAAAPLVQEKIGRLGEFAGFAGFLFHDVEPDPALLDERILDARRNAARGGRALDRGGDRGSAEAPLRRARGEAADRVPRRSASRSRARASRRACTRASSSSAGTRRSRASGRRRRRVVSGAAATSSASSSARRRWIEVTQERIDAFAAATDDPQWIHVDPRASRRRPVRDDDRARLPHALALRPDALRAAASDRRDGWSNYGVEPRALPGAGAVGQPGARTLPRCLGRGHAVRRARDDRGQRRVRGRREAGVRRPSSSS